MTKKTKIIFIVAISVLLSILATIGFVWKFNRYSLALSITDKVITIEYGTDKIPEVTALCKGSLINRKGTPVTTTMNGDVCCATLTINISSTFSPSPTESCTH